MVSISILALDNVDEYIDLERAFFSISLTGIIMWKHECLMVNCSYKYIINSRRMFNGKLFLQVHYKLIDKCLLVNCSYKYIIN